MAALCLMGAAADGAEKLPAGLKVVAMEAYPSVVELKQHFDYRQLLLTGRLETGESVDLTRMATLAQPSKLVSVSPTGLVRPVADGSEQLVFKFEGHSAAVKVSVSGAAAPYSPSFIRDIQPAFSKMGCNAGTCHGSREGKNGFKLSLRGYDALYDYRAFTDDVSARRFNRAAPEQSLMLLKASGSIPHVGGVRTQVGEPYYELVRDWIANGVKFDPDSQRVAKIDIAPLNPIVPLPGMKQQMSVIATYTDGATRDVTREAFIESGNIEVIEADSQGVLTMLRRGEAPVLVRYDGNYAATTLICMGDRTGFAWQQPPTYNYIDELVYKKLQRVKILPSDLCADEEFVRRVYLDLTGLPPTSDQVRAFLTDPRESKQKRDALVDSLVGSHEYVEHWTNKWADMLQVNRKFLGEEGAVALRNWIEQNVASNKPYDQFAYEVMTAKGSNLENPPAAYFKTLREPAETMENTTHLFLAVRFNCNKCHDHPFERWTQDQYYHLAAYFAQIGRKEDPNYANQKIGGSAVEGAVPLVEVIYDTGSGEVKHDRTGQITPPAFPYEHAGEIAQAASRREQLARWVASKDNQYFARSYVNRLWGYMFGKGIIEPIDDIRAGNPPTNPDLLDALTADFINSGFDVQHMMRTICKSRAYQHSVRTNKWNEDDEINYARALPRRLPAEVLYDAIHVATGSTPKIPGVPVGFRAAELPDVGVSVPFLEDFGRPVRESACECERSDSMVLGPIMKLINGPTVSEAIADPSNALTQLAVNEKDDAKLIREVFLRFFARYPTEEELQLGRDALSAAGEGHDKQVAALAEYEKQLPAKQAEWEQSLGADVLWTALDPVEMKSQVGATFAKQDDNSLLVSGKNGKDVYTVVAHADLKGITAIRLEALTDAKLPAGGPGRAQNGNFVLNELSVTAAPKSDAAKAETVGLQNASADFNQFSWHVAGAIDGSESTGWAVSPEFNKRHEAIFETKQDIGHDGGTVLTFTFSHQFQDSMHTLGRFRLSVTTAKRPVGVNRLSDELVKLLSTPADQRTDAQQAAVANYYRSLDPELARLTAEVQRSAEQLKNQRLVGVQDLAWALINNPAFLFNR
jgi:hypothetical protein